MQPLLSVLFGVVVISISACTSKAPQGHGGFAEHDLSNYPSHPIGLENALYFEQQLRIQHLDDLVLAGAVLCFPASVKTAQIRQGRIARELRGGLGADAANDLIIQRDQLDQLERRLSYEQLQGSCLSNNSNNPVDTQNEELSADKLQAINNLLNYDNQFVFSSAELNPKYIEHLAEAASMLKPYSNYQLKITGHADTKGSDVVNLDISLQRAQKVERYLQRLGLNPSNISVQRQGAKTPLFDGDEPQVRLVNRRVTIEVIELSHAQGTAL